MYDRQKAAAWARNNVLSTQPFASSCARFVYQALQAGGVLLPDVDSRIPLESTDMSIATKAHLLWRYLVVNSLAVEEVVFWPDYQPDTLSGLMGDILVYDWEGCLHMALIVGYDRDGIALVSEWGLAGRSGLRSTYSYRQWLWSQNGKRPIVDIHPDQTILLLRIG